MKTLLTFLLFAALTPNDWVGNIDELVLEIDTKAIEIIAKSKFIEETDFRFKQTQFKFEKNVKSVFKIDYNVESNFAIAQTFYERQNLIFAAQSLLIVPIISKGKRDDSSPTFQLYESNIYFDNKKKGLEFSRTIHGFEHQNVDSLKNELKKLPFEKKRLEANDYEDLEQKLKDLNKTYRVLKNDNN